MRDIKKEKTTDKEEKIIENNESEIKKQKPKNSKKKVRNIVLIVCSVLVVIGFVTFLICMFARPMQKANALFSMDLVAVQGDNGKWGYVNSKGTNKIGYKYDSALNFSSNGLALVKIGDKYGYINTEGKLKIRAIYDEALSFENGVAIVKFEGKYGVINSNGKVLTKNPNTNNVSKDNLKGYFYENIKPFENGYAAAKYEGKFGLINLKGDKVFDFKFDDIASISNGVFAYAIDEKYGYVKLDGTKLTGPIYDKTNPFDKNGFAVVNYSDSSGDNKTVIIDMNGNFVYDEYNLNSVQRLSNGYMIVNLGEKFGVLNSKLETVIEAKYQSLTFGGGKYLVYSTTGEKFGYLDFNGKPVIEEKFNYASSFNKIAVVKAKQDEKFFTVLGSDFKTKFTFECDELSDFSNGIAVFKKAGYYGYINDNGKVIFEPTLRFASNCYIDGFAIVMTVDGKYGIINKSGKYITSAKFANIVFNTYVNV